MPTPKQLLQRIAKVGVAACAAAATVAAVLLSSVMSVPTHTQPIAQAEVTVGASSQQSQACMGPLLRQSTEATYTSTGRSVFELLSVGSADLSGRFESSAARPRTGDRTEDASPEEPSNSFGVQKLARVSGGGAQADTAGAPATAAETQTATEPNTTLPASIDQPLRLQSHSSATERPSAAQSQRIRTDTMSGFVATRCVQPHAESWLVAGSTVSNPSSGGAASYILLSNPGNVPATVTLNVFDEQGVVAGTGNQSIVVAPHTQRVATLNSFAPNSASLVVQVLSRGAPIVAMVQESHISGLTPLGTDASAAVVTPGTELVIPGVRMTDAPAADFHDDEVSLPVLRLFAPGSESSSVTVTAHTGDGKSIPLGSFEAAPGLVNQFRLDALPQGISTVTLSSAQPILASLHTTVSQDDAEDFVTVQAADLSVRDTYFSVAAGPSPTLTVYNAGSEDVNVLLERFGEEASRTELKIAAGQSVNQQVGERVSYRLQATGNTPIAAAVSYSDATSLSGYSVTDAAVTEGSLRIFTR